MNYTYKKVKGYIEVYKDGVFQFTADDMAEALRETTQENNKGAENYE